MGRFHSSLGRFFLIIWEARKPTIWEDGKKKAGDRRLWANLDRSQCLKFLGSSTLPGAKGIPGIRGFKKSQLRASKNMGFSPGHSEENHKTMSMFPCSSMNLQLFFFLGVCVCVCVVISFTRIRLDSVDSFLQKLGEDSY